MDFIDMLLDKKRALQLTNREFADKIGVTRSWIVNKFNPNGRQYPLRESTMYKLNTVLNIPYSVMEDYNAMCRGK